jgi:hypothetical protein
MGRGPVCGMMTRRAGGPEGAAGSVVAASTEATSGAASASDTEAGAGVGSAAGGGVAVAVGASAGGGAGATGFAATGACATGWAAAVTAGRSCDAWGGVAATTGGRAMTGPMGGLLAMAGGGAGATMFACWRGRGTMRRGAGDPACGAGVLADAGWAGAPALGGVATAGACAGGAATTNAGRAGGAALMAASACLRSRIALRASPGFETLERSNFGLLSTAGLFELAERPPALK